MCPPFPDKGGVAVKLWRRQQKNRDYQDNWAEPVTLEEGIRRRDEVLSEAQDIEDQLGDPDRQTDDEGYRQWRGKAKVALKYKLAEYRRLRTWVQLNRRAPSPSRLADVLNPMDLTTRLREVTYHLYSTFRAAGTYIDDPSERNLRVLEATHRRAASVLRSK
jgi:hypothetical protein